MTNSQRQAKLREKREALGFKPVTVWLPLAAIPEFQALAAMCRENPNSRPVSISLQDNTTGRMRGVKLR